MDDEQLSEGSEDEFAPGLVLSGKFRIVRLIARGGMGAVYEAEQLALQRRVAIKTLRPELAEDPQLRQRFVREGRVAARVRHPHIVEVIDTGEHETTPYLVMELLDGNDLSAHVRSRGRITITEAMDLLLPVCAAIASAHDLGVVHRDIKPENVALVRLSRGTVVAKLVDFGLSKNLNSATAKLKNITEARAVIGTPLYMSPEAVLGPTHLDARSDQYSFAVLLFECVTGRTPYTADTLSELIRAIAKGNPPRPSALAPNLANGVDDVILRGMHVERARRFANMWDMGAALLPFASDRARAQWAETFTAGSRRSTLSQGAALPSPEPQVAASVAPPKRSLPMPARIAALTSVVALCAVALRWTLTAPRAPVAPTPSPVAEPSRSHALDQDASPAVHRTDHVGPAFDRDARARASQSGDEPIADAALSARPSHSATDAGRAARGAARDGGRRTPPGTYEIY